MENTQEVKEDQRSFDVPSTKEDDKTNVEITEEVTTDKLAPQKPNGKKKSQDQEKGRSKDQQSVREHHRRGERSKGGRAAFKGSVYRPRSRPECRVHISNIPYEYRWQDLKDLFRSEVGEVSFVELFEDEYGKPRGCGIVEFEKLEHARIALEKMNRFELKGRRLIVKEDVDVERGADASASGRQESRNHISSSYSSGREYGGDVSYSGRKGVPGGSIGTLTSPSSTRWSNTYGLSPQFLDSLGIPGPLIDRIFVANLDYKVDDAKLREVFRLAGKVVVAEVVKDRDGRSRGFGVLQMSHPVEAVQAISMFNNQMLYDRRMTVRMDRDAERIDTHSSRYLPEGLRSIGMGLGTRGDPLRDLPRDGLLSPQGRPSNSYTSGSMNFSSRHHDRVDASVNDFMPSLDAGFGHLSGTTAMRGSIERSIAGLPSMGSNQSMHNLPMNDYRMSNLGSGYNVGAESGSSLSLNGIADSSNSAPYGYLTESFLSKGSISTSVHDYERREVYDSYRTNQLTRGKHVENYSTSTEYDAGNRMSSMGPSVSTSSSLAPSGGSSRLSDTIVVTNLPLNYNWQDLRDKFCEVGDVLFADIRAKGTGLVRFSSERDAQRACSMLNRTRMEGYTIEVNFY